MPREYGNRPVFFMTGVRVSHSLDTVTSPTVKKCFFYFSSDGGSERGGEVISSESYFEFSDIISSSAVSVALTSIIDLISMSRQVNS